MRILILNGSPSGENSITLQTIRYLEKRFPKHTYEVLHVGQRIKSMEKDFSQCIEAIERARLIIFCYPVYTFLVPAQLHRFIELMKENAVDVKGKYATQLTTSKHFYDITAHRFIEDICEDLELRYVRGMSADMEDLLTGKGQREARDFFRFVCWHIRNDFAERTRKPIASAVTFAPQIPPVPEEGVSKTGHRVALVTDLDTEEPSLSLDAMIRCFEKCMPAKVNVINIREFPFAGGCLGCFNCASDGVCVYKDGFDTFLREKINDADAVVYAFTIKDHSMGSRFKMFDDRQFCNGHRTVTMGKPVAYLIDGDIGREENLRMLIDARAEVGGNFLAGIASNVSDPRAEIRFLAARLSYCLKHRFSMPQNFYGVGGMKIFRDLIFKMQGLMKEDHRFYKEHNFYDFPQKDRIQIASMYLISAMMNNKALRKKLNINMTEGMLMPYRKVIEKV